MHRFLPLLTLGALLLPAQVKKIVVVRQSPAIVADWQAVSNKIKIVRVASDAELRAELADADAFIGEITPEQVRIGKKLQWVQIQSAGVERVLHLSGGDDLRNSNIILTNNQIVQGPEIADHAMAMLLALSRNLPLYFKDRSAENWRREAFTGIELNTKKATIIGCGGIGQQIAVRAWAHGMKVTCVDPEDIPFSPFIVKTVKPDRLDEELPDTDALFISAPHTPKSHKMVGPKQFELMKKNSYFIAVSRGGVYDLPSLVKALDSQRLKGAGVDVVDPEPLPQGHALWKFENAIITPHIAGRSDLDNARMLGIVKENIRRFAEGLPLVNVVDKQKGY
ncbi:D-2-hydroxyacid dehydrogenase [Bryobacter aggregatus]|uniref:D-2-hydroxyacid dehydrogenase n=1 Tax=Bryobacter aggregatus TaxID=360054 RepID=UPI0004E1267A|nr:D-2-hydroxyacid dehydrogenase [Bryobacter aggregatus]